MRPINLRFAGDCRKCGAALVTGQLAIYERGIGVFCTTCGPTNPDEIRNYREERGERKATRYDDWAEKRRTKAAALVARNEPYRGDIAFNTQPGHIPERARAIARTDRAWEHTKTANAFEAKAASLRHVVVAGDRERAREAKREKARAWVKVGMAIRTHIYGVGIVERINRKTARVGQTGTSGTYSVNVDLSWLMPA